MKSTTAVAALFLAMSSMTMSAAQADVIYYFTKTGFYNGTSITDPNTFASATFKTTTTNNVSLTMTVLPGLDSGGYVNDWAFNISSGFTSLTRTLLSGVAANNIEFGNNIVNNFGGTGGDFDLAFHFDTSNPGQLAVNGKSVYNLSATGLTESSFSIKNNAGLFSAVKVQGYGASSEYKSGDPTDNPVPPTSVPEPTTVALLGLGLLGFAASRRKANKS